MSSESDILDPAIQALPNKILEIRIMLDATLTELFIVMQQTAAPTKRMAFYLDYF